MKKADIVPAWIALGDAKPGYDEFCREMARPIDPNSRSPYGFAGVIDLLDMVFREDNVWLCYKARQAFCSKRVAKLKSAARRPRYYDAENARRRALASERRKVRVRRTTNVCPTAEQVLEAWRRRRESHEAAMRFGGMLEDLECYLDNSLIRNRSGAIIGRNAGIKGWLFDNVPEISQKYTTAMRFKAAARKMRQIAELADPNPIDSVLPPEGNRGDCQVEKPDASGTVCHSVDVPEVQIVRARAIWEEVVRGVRPSATALFERIDALLDPESVQEANMLAAWREKYKNEITVRTKLRWWTKRLWNDGTKKGKHGAMRWKASG